MGGAIAALAFLTALPVGRHAAVAGGDLRGGVLLFPAIGAFVGGLAAVAGWGAAIVLPPVPAAVLSVAAGVLVTGALHVDGLADTADGVGASLAGGHPGPAMEDPRLGTFGGSALVLDLLLRVSVVSAFLADGRFPRELLAAGALARTSVVVLALVVPYAGPRHGASSWIGTLDRRRSLASLGTGAAIGFITIGVRFVAMVVVAAFVCAIVGRWSSRRLGGMRGDTFGAVAELVETLALAAALATR
jgi:adenosylcobinamide-GDP ribazoletransferase